MYVLNMYIAKTFCLPEKHAFIVCKAFKTTIYTSLKVYLHLILITKAKIHCGLVKVVTSTKIIFVFCFVSLHKSAFCFNDSGGPD